jgi:hypothetical protein
MHGQMAQLCKIEQLVEFEDGHVASVELSLKIIPKGVVTKYPELISTNTDPGVSVFNSGDFVIDTERKN